MLEDEVEWEVLLVSPYLRTGRPKQMRREAITISQKHVSWNSPG
jgi:hypothetical protein